MLAYSADDVIAVGKVGFACLAAVDLGTVEIRVVDETHFDRFVRVQFA